MASGGMKLEGDKALERKLRALPERVQRRVLRSAVSASASPVVKAAKRKAPKESGALRRSLGKKIVTNKRRQSVTAIVGPRMSVQGTHKGKLRKPSRYAHLAEKGFIDEHGNHHPPQPYLKPAMQETQGQALTAMKSKVAEGVTREAAKGSR